MKHRYALSGAIAIGLMVAFLLVGRARAAGPEDAAWVPATSATWQYRPDGSIGTIGDADIVDMDLDSTRRKYLRLDPWRAAC